MSLSRSSGGGGSSLPSTIIAASDGTLTASTLVSTGGLSVGGGKLGISALGVLTTGSIPSVNLTGSITNAQITSLATTKLTGTITDAQIAAIAASKLTGTVSDSQIAGMSASKLIGNVLDVQLTSISASKITGTVTDSQVAGLSASKLTGTVPITNLSGITTTQLSTTAGIVDGQLVSISAAKITGTISDAQIASGITASKISGALSTATLATSALTGTITAAQVASVNPSTLTGTGTIPVAALPLATTSAIGVIKVSTGLAIDGSGNLTTLFVNPMTTAGDIIYEGGGVDVARGAATTSLGPDSFGANTNAVDGNNSTAWGTNGVQGQWLQLNLGSPKTVSSSYLLQASGNGFINNYQVQGWNGSSWVTVATGAPISTADTLTFAPATYQVWRLQALSTQNGYGGVYVYTFSLLQAVSPTRLSIGANSSFFGVNSTGSLTYKTIAASDISVVNPSALTGTGTVPAAAMGTTVLTKTANYTLATTDSFVIANAASLTITLPAAASAVVGRPYTIKNGASGTSTTISATSGTIDGAATYTGLATANFSVQLFSDGSNWFIF